MNYAVEDIIKKSPNFETKKEKKKWKKEWYKMSEKRIRRDLTQKGWKKKLESLRLK